MTTRTHSELATLWLNYNGQRATTKQIIKTKKQLDFYILFRMLQERKQISQNETY